MKKVMFICSGNTCRSPLAEGLFRHWLANENISDIEVSSAGVSVFPGDEVSVNSAIIAINRGVNISLHRARQLNPQHIPETDLFVCMTLSHARALQRFCDSSKIMVLNVPDPYGKSLEIYEECAKIIESQFSQILEKIKALPTVTKMSESDIKEIAELEKACFSEPWSEKALSEELSNPTARFYVLRQGEKLLGYIGANNVCDEVYITNVAVNEEYRGKGYGKCLVRHLLKQSEKENALFVTLEVRESNENAISLYSACGFKQVGRRKGFYSKPQEDALLYTVYLKNI